MTRRLHREIDFQKKANLYQTGVESIISNGEEVDREAVGRSFARTSPHHRSSTFLRGKLRRHLRNAGTKGWQVVEEALADISKHGPDD